jgi:uncharacterized protein
MGGEGILMKYLALLALIATQAVSAAAPASTYRGPIIDAHAHVRLGEDDWTKSDQPKGVAALRDLDEKAGVARSALIVIGFGDPASVRAKNDAVIALSSSDPAHFYPVASVNPDNGDASLAELDRVAGLGVKIIKLYPSAQEFDIANPVIAKITQRCGERGMAVLFDSFDPFDAAQVGKFVKLTMSQPGTKFILAHMTFARFRETITFSMLRRMNAGNNVWFDLSAIATTYAGSPMQAELVWTIRKIGTDRMIFGSDWPLYSPAEALAATRKLGMSVSEQRQVFHDNISSLMERR